MDWQAKSRWILTHVDGAWEHLALSQNSKSVVKICNVVFGLVFVSVERFQVLQHRSRQVYPTYLQFHGGVVLGHLVGSCSLINFVEQLVDDPRRCPATKGKSTVL